ncbi:MAG: hypothetical protein FWD26_04190 [Treponema sp.]|nr:hypothetical protein [Treponema sp.]
MSGKKLVGFCVLLLLAISVLFIACDLIGLGTVVNTDIPVINNSDEGARPGDFLSGPSNIIWLEVIQDFGVDFVFMEIEFTCPQNGVKRDTIDADYDPVSGEWFVNIDTTGMMDGAIKAWVTAIDISGKRTTSTEIIYTVKNTLPQVELTIPRVRADDFEDVEYLNNVILQGNPVIQGEDIIGIASDLSGIAQGYPKILFWPANVTLDSEGMPDNSMWSRWYTAVDEKWETLNKDGVKAVQFRWPMVEMVQNGENWVHDPAEQLDPGNYNLKVWVKDKVGRESIYPQDGFMTIRYISTSNPIITLNVPPYYNGKNDFEINDMIVSGANPIQHVYAMITNPEDTPDFVNGNFSIAQNEHGSHTYIISIPKTDFPANFSGDKMLHVEAVDMEGNSTRVERRFIVDEDDPTLEFIEPSGFGTAEIKVTSRVIFKGSSEDNQRVAGIYYALGKTETAAAADGDTSTWRNTMLDTDSPFANHPGANGTIDASWSGSLSSWSWQFHDINDLCNPANRAVYVDNIAGTNLWTLPIKFMVVDVADNYKVYNEQVIIDPDADLPTVDIISHTHNQFVSGTVRLNGTAMDNEMIHSVEIRVFQQTNAQCGTSAPPATQVINWTPVSLVGNPGLNRGWHFTLNNDGSLNPPQNGGTRQVRVELRARDAFEDNTPTAGKQYGQIETITLHFSNALPTIGDIKIIRGNPSQITTAPREDYVFGAIVSEYITLAATVQAVTPVTSIVLRGHTVEVDLFGEGGIIAKGAPSGNDPWVVHNGNNNYSLYIPLDTNETLASSAYKDKAGNYDIDIQVFDSTTPVPHRAHTVLSLQIDNFYPLAVYSGNWNAFGNYSISGSAWDRGDGIAVADVSAVVVYFSRNGAGVSLWENTAQAGSRPWVTSSPPQSARTGRTGNTSTIDNPGTGPAPLDLFPNVRQPNGTFATTNSGIVINDNGMVGDYQMSFTGNPDKEWSVIFDTTRLRDGPVTLHYVVFDRAGNASHYTQPLLIANNRPVFAGLSIGTDLNSSNTITDDEYMSLGVGSSVLNPDFRIRNSRFSVRINASGGNPVSNPERNHKVYYATRSGPGAILTKGEVYSIAAVGNTNWVNYGVFSSAGPGVVFTSTADGTIAGSGTVYLYTAVDPVTGTLINNAPIAYNTFNADMNSLKDPNGAITGANRNARFFVIKVFDNTVSSQGEAEQLSSAAVIALDIDNDDTQIPLISINPFYWNSVSDNSLYQNSKAEGHIELEADLPSVFNETSGIRDRDPKVSGRVSFRGTASDNVTLGAIYFRISNYTAASGNGHGTTGTTIDGSNYYLAASCNAGIWTTAGSVNDFFNTHGWKFTIVNETFTQAGHSIEWQLDFDSRFITGVASLDNILSVIARDTKTPTANQSALAQYRFDVVPYISKIETNIRLEGGLKDVNIRSADGKYSIVQGNNPSFITVRGFNLPNNTADSVRILDDDRNTDHRNNPGAVPTGTGVTNFTPTTFSADRTSFTMTNNSPKSGYLTVVVGAIGSLNNINNNDSRSSLMVDNRPNMEADRNVTKNLRLSDDRYLQFYTVNKTDVINGFYPVMLMNYDNPVFAYIKYEGGNAGVPKPGRTGETGLGILSNNTSPGRGVYGAGTGPFSIPQNAASQRAEFNFASGATRYIEYLIKNVTPDQMAMAVDQSENYSNSGNLISGRYGHFTVHNNSFSGSTTYIYDRFAELQRRTIADGSCDVAGWAAGNIIARVADIRANDPNNTAISFNAITPLYPANSIWYPKLIMRGNSEIAGGFAANYLAYFDDTNFTASGSTTANNILFRTFQVGTGNTAPRTTRLSPNADPRHFDNYGRQYETFTNIAAGGNIDAGRNRVASGASKHFDMGVITTGNTTNNNHRVVVVYFEESSGRLRLSYSTLDTINGSQTGANAVAFTASNITFPANTGMYVSMFIDGTDIHIAAFDHGINALRYIFIPSFETNQAHAAQSYIIDEFGTPGHWTDIKVRNGVPYIAYYNALENGGRDPIKIAFAKAPVTGEDAVGARAGVDANGFVTGFWEYRTVPALDPPQGGHSGFQKVNLGFTSTGIPVLGYLGSNIEFSYPIGE